MSSSGVLLMRAVKLIVACVIFSCASCVDATELFIVGAINGGQPKKEKVFFLERGDTLRLYAIIKTQAGYTGPIREFEEQGEHRAVEQVVERKGGTAISWQHVAAVLSKYNNLRDGNRAQPIRYRARQINVGAMISIPGAAGTMDLGTSYVALGGVLAKHDFAETLPLHEKYPFRVIQVVYRQDDTYIGFLTELFHTPFVLAPMVTAGGFHQTENRMGCDCASFAIYGRRRQGYRIPYNGPRGILHNLDELVVGPLYHRRSEAREIYVGVDGKPVSTRNLQPGDIVHFGEQVSVFYRDVGVPGILDQDDELMQCYGNTPVIKTFAESGFFNKAIRLFRWRETTRGRSSDQY